MVSKVEILMDGKVLTDDTLVTIQNKGKNAIIFEGEKELDLKDDLSSIYAVQVNITKVPLFNYSGISIEEKYLELVAEYEKLQKLYLDLCQSVMDKYLKEKKEKEVEEMKQRLDNITELLDSVDFENI